MTYRSGGAYGICDECGLQYRLYDLRLRWDKALVCRRDWEPKHPQESVRALNERIGIRDARPDTYTHLVFNACTDDPGAAGWAATDLGWVHSSGVDPAELAITGLTVGGAYSLQVLIDNRVLGSVTVELVTVGESDSTSGNEQLNIAFTAGATTDTVRITPTGAFDGAVRSIAIYPGTSGGI